MQRAKVCYVVGGHLRAADAPPPLVVGSLITSSALGRKSCLHQGVAPTFKGSRNHAMVKKY